MKKYSQIDANFKNHLRSLVQLALSDEQFDTEEKKMIYNLGMANKISKYEINSLIQEELSKKHFESVTFSPLSFDERFEFLYNIIQLMKVDRKVFLAEIKYCEGTSRRLGFKERVVGELSKKIFADPVITANRQVLRKIAKRYEL
tara:strand:- start:5227 stop:5661 length:435 start_codon:yes stop_codon:yes gene_type:complete